MPDDTDPLAVTQASDRGKPIEAREHPLGDPEAEPAVKKRAVHVGDVLGRYELGEELGEGGMATVYRARDRELRRDVAIKVLFPHLARRTEIVRRFHREARTAAGLEHPNILRIYDVGDGDGDDPPYIVMELIRGRTLLEEIEQRGPMLAEIAASIGSLLADALGAAHRAGIVHRDVKPSNVLVDPGARGDSGARLGGRLLLADFGVARLETEDSLVTRTGALLGTPAYMSPEQASGDIATAKSDLYSLGATLYQLATGSLPYTGSPAKMMSLLALGAAVPAVRRRPAVGPDLSRVIARLMATDPEARPASAAEVATELRAIAAAGGLGDPTDELAAYLADPDAFVRVRTPAVVSAVVTAATRAVAAAKLPRAMALADRASALAPDDPAVAALIHTITLGGRASRRRRALAIGGLGLALAGGAAVGIARLRGGDPIPLDAAAAVAIDARVVPAISEDAAAIAMIVDAAPPIDAAVVRGRADAGRRIDAASVEVAPPVDAALPMMVELDAAIAPATGAILVENDTWCEISIDGTSHGRARNTPIRVVAGHHVVVCAQPGKTWTQAVDVAAGETRTVRGSMLGSADITFAIDATIDGVPHRRGEVVHLKAGRYPLEAGGVKKFVDFRAACVVRDRPELDCYP